MDSDLVRFQASQSVEFQEIMLPHRVRGLSGIPCSGASTFHFSVDMRDLRDLNPSSQGPEMGSSGCRLLGGGGTASHEGAEKCTDVVRAHPKTQS